MSGRVHKSLMNVKVGVIFYFLSAFITFFSRRIFLQCLGDQFIGLTGTLWSILNLLNITEVGIGTCIGYFLYKPIEQKDHSKICELVSLFGWLYRIIGSIVLFGGFLISLFFPLIFDKEDISLGIVYFTFYSFLMANIIGYFINYRQILLDSDQKTYKISQWTGTGSIAKNIIQIVLAYYYKNLYLWVAVELVFSFVVCWILNYVISKEYPWLKTDKSKGSIILKKYPDILIKVKQIIIHRLKNALLSKCDEIFIFAFESLQMVTFYGNYTMIVGKLTGIFNNVLVGMNAGIGNLVAEDNKQNIKKVFWEFITFRYWTTGIFIICLTYLINPIIQWWLGENYVLPDHIVFLILFQMYIMLTGPSIALFINAYGLYDDTWSAYTEGLINIIITISIGWKYGLVGILLGKVVSLIIFAIIWRPIYLYKKGFKEPTRSYWIGFFKHILILIQCLIINFITIKILNWTIEPTLKGIFCYFAFISLPIILLYTYMVYLLTPGAKDLLHRLPIKKIVN